MLAKEGIHRGGRELYLIVRKSRYVRDQISGERLRLQPVAESVLPHGHLHRRAGLRMAQGDIAIRKNDARLGAQAVSFILAHSGTPSIYI
ncbi:hypothetical protein [Tateyamaria sp.]|uniref:hypothetical protein n=1 Tax=Tateyamaria sp. TaxID=1929288 RepID=UPI003B219DB1